MALQRRASPRVVIKLTGFSPFHYTKVRNLWKYLIQISLYMPLFLTKYVVDACKRLLKVVYIIKICFIQSLY